mmetsp:Transcript_61706/g.113667  ORF Transcript_61706/g.113667 Transcript_61706/m.113667 type:complete len:637 (+) Transcript_61706:1356-3266(+)
MADGDAAVQKRLKALRKKLAQIEKLEGKGGSLSPEEAEKVSAKADIEAEITVLEAKGDEPEPTSAPAPTPAPKATPVVAAVPEVAAEPVKQPAPEEVISITEAPPVEEAPAEVVSEQLQVGGPEALKRIKNLKKKLAQINKLKEKGGDLSVEEAEKVASEESILSEIAVLEGKEAPKVSKKAAPEKQVFAPSERMTKPAAPASDTAEPKATAETQKEDAAPVPEGKGPTGLERCAELIPRLLLEPEAEKKAKALQKKLRDIEKLKEKRTTEGKLEKLQEEKVAGEERLLKELGELEVAYPPRQNKRQGRKTYDEEGEDEAELAKSKPAEEEDDDDEDEAKEKRSKNPGKDSVAQKTRQQVPAASTKSKGTVSALWVVFCANAMVAVDWLSFCNGVLKKARQSQDGSLGSNGDGEVAFLLIDYPGYGVNLGKPDPAGILEASHRAVVAALAHFAECRPQVHLLGHSLGAACAAQLSVKLAAEGFTPGRLVLSAPFLSIPHVLVHWFCEYASQAKSGCGKCAGRCFITCGRWPLLCLLSVIMPHRWGNKSNVRRAVRAGWQLGIMHGLKDHMVPVVMGRELHRRASATAASAGNSPVTYIEVPSADHNDMLNVAVADYGVLMGLLRAPDHRASPPASA